jgi:hypothetical protein
MDASGPAQSQPAAAGAEQLHPALAALLARKALLKGRFKIVEFLDMGGFATVFRCLDTKTGKEVRKSQRLMNSTSPAWQAVKLHVDNCKPANLCWYKHVSHLFVPSRLHNLCSPLTPAIPAC